MRQSTGAVGRMASLLAAAGCAGGLGTSALAQDAVRSGPGEAQPALSRPAITHQAIEPVIRCKPGFVWREAAPGDRVCVSPTRRTAVAEENRLGPGRVQPGGGAYGPATCQQGYVWREAQAGDVVCVEPRSRDWVRDENRSARYTRVGGPADCHSAEHCAQRARQKRREAEELRRRIEARQRQLRKAEADHRRALEQLRREDEEWMRRNPGLGRTTQPSVTDNVTPLRREIDEMEKALREAEREAASADAESRRP